MKLVNEKLAGLKIQIGKEIVTVSPKGEIEVDEKDKETLEAMTLSGFLPVAGKKGAAKDKTPVGATSDNEEPSGEMTEAPKAETEETEEKKSLTEKISNRFQKRGK